MIKIGITGGIGSGKTIISSLLKGMGYPVFDADTESKRLCNEYEPLKQKLTVAFGKEIYDNTGQLNKAAFATIIFNDPRKLQLANSIIHPQVIEAFLAWAACNQSKLVFVESAILLECALESQVDKIVVVTAPEDVRIQRVMSREGVGAEAVKARMKNQLPEPQRLAKADYVISNDYVTPVIPQVEEMLQSVVSSVSSNQ
ncbi:MAG: dephospho-CoA kinase [Paludibacteraceae bacterium]|nr:dephospho-CoA kinase [Paludibacteraceae bacterium]